MVVTLLPPDVAAAELQDVRNVLAEYCIAVDAQDWDAVHALFDPEALSDYSALALDDDGADAAFTDGDRVASWIKNHIGGAGAGGGRQTVHALTTQKLQMTSDQMQCFAVTYFRQDTFLTNVPGGLAHYVVHGLFRDELVRKEDGRWVIMSRVIETLAPRMRADSTIDSTEESTIAERISGLC